MPFSRVSDFEKSFPAVADMSPEQKQKCMDIFNAMKKENPQMDDGMAIATAMKKVKAMMSEFAEWSNAQVNDLPDSSFGYIAPGGTKDDQNKTVPRSLRKLPYKDATGKVDLPHIRNALARLPQSDIPSDKQDSIRKKLEADLKKANEMSDGLFHVYMLSDNISEIEILKVGKVSDRDLTITSEMLDSIVQNFTNGAYGTEVQVNIGHYREGEAAGWIKKVYRVSDVLMAEVEWTPLGMEKIRSKQFKFTSSEISFGHQHISTGEDVGDVLIGVALTNIPAVKGMRPVTFSENTQNFINNIKNMKTKLQKLFAELNSKDKISKIEFSKFEEEVDAAIAADESVKDEADKMKDDLETKVEPSEEEKKKAEDEAKAKAKADADAKAKEEEEAKKKEELNEKGKMVSLSESELLKLREDASKGAQALAELTKEKFKKEVSEKMCLSEKVGVGFVKNDPTITKVAEFMMGLSEKMLAEFKTIMSNIRAVDLSVRGYTPEPSAVTPDKEKMLSEANEQAEKLSKESGKPMHECLQEIYAKNGLDKLV